MPSVRIIGTGSYVPAKRLTNFDLQKMGLDTSDEWIVSRTGIKERRIAEPDVATSDLACEAAKKALNVSGMTIKDIDLIIVATITPDTCCPSCANWIEAKLDASHAVSFDITAACSGFVFALNVAQQYLHAGIFRHVLVVAAEIMSRTLDWTDRSSCILWGDGAGAAILAMDDKGPELLSTSIHTDGANGKELLMPGGGSMTTPISHESVDKKLHTLRMIQANASFRVAVRHFIESIQEAVEQNNITIEDIDLFVPHQANLRMFQSISKILDIPMDKFYFTLQKYGNISSASCAIALDEAIRDGSIRPGHIVCMPVFGGGLTWGNALIRF